MRRLPAPSSSATAAAIFVLPTSTARTVRLTSGVVHRLEHAHELLALRAHRVLVGVAAREPLLAAQRGDGNAVDGAAEARAMALVKRLAKADPDALASLIDTLDRLSLGAARPSR